MPHVSYLLITVSLKYCWLHRRWSINMCWMSEWTVDRWITVLAAGEAGRMGCLAPECGRAKGSWDIQAKWYIHIIPFHPWRQTIEKMHIREHSSWWNGMLLLIKKGGGTTRQISLKICLRSVGIYIQDKVWCSGDTATAQSFVYLTARPQWLQVKPMNRQDRFLPRVGLLMTVWQPQEVTTVF